MENKYFYVLYETESSYNNCNSHFEVHRILSGTNIFRFTERLNDYYSYVNLIGVFRDDKDIEDYCNKNKIEINIDYERKWYGCYDNNSTYDGDISKVYDNEPWRKGLCNVEEAPKDKTIEEFIVEYDYLEIEPKIKKEKYYG